MQVGDARPTTVSPVTATPPSLHVFPSADPIFGAYAAEILRTSAAQTPEAFQAKLRAMYPAAAVRARSPLGELMPQSATWYVYRDGHG
jgi:hypothetical protein